MAVLGVPLPVVVVVGSILLFLGRAVVKYIQYERKRVQMGCPPMPRYPGWDSVLGSDYVYAMLQALKKNRFLPFQKESYYARNSKVWTANFLGNRMVYSSDPANMKAMSTSHKDCFAVEPIRVGNGAITPFTGRGVSSSDGPHWQWSRDLVKPYFERQGFANLGRLQEHTDRMIAQIPMDCSTVQMQSLFQRWVSSNESRVCRNP